MVYKEKYEQWCNSNDFDEKTKKELEEIKNNEKEIEDRFYKDLEFGTAGLRGMVGAGTNRMNYYTVGRATQGIANFIIRENGEKKGVVIAYDCRNMSYEFCEKTALTLNANGIKTYVFKSLRPTPVLSFAIRELGCVAGIVITASHNPPAYNGFKVYWDDGVQITYPKDEQIIKEVNSILDYSIIKNITKEDAIEKGLYNVLDCQIDDKYIETIKKVSINKENIDKNIKIVYTPLHGTGSKFAKRILKEMGFNNVFTVEEQDKPDGNFSTVEFPNPEDPKAFEYAIKLAQKEDADIIFANDPDADRIGVFAKDNRNGEYIRFTGNMTAQILIEYILSEKQKNHILPPNSAIVETIVSSNMTKSITDHYNVKLFEVLTGFKYIGQKMKEFKDTNLYEFQFGYEEAFGCVIGEHSRDKDGIVAVMLVSEAAAFYKAKGISLVEQMEYLYKKYGYYQEEGISIILPGADGAEKINNMMEKIRKEPLKQIGQYKVVKIRDYQEEIITDMITGEISKTELPNSNVIYYELENNAWCCIRPSGTEPKIKFYMGVKEKSLEEAKETLQEIIETVKKLS